MDVKIDDDVMIKALDQNETGNYNHLLLKDYPELNPDQTAQQEQRAETKQESQSEPKNEYSEPGEPQLFDEEKSESESGDEEDGVETRIQHIEIETDPSDETSKKDPRIAKTGSSGKDVKPQTTDTERSVKSVDWADVGRKFNQEKKHTPVWIIGLIIILIIAAFVGYFLYQNGFLNIQGLMPEQQEQVTPESETSQSSLSLDLEDSLAASEAGNETATGAAAESAVELDEVLELTVYAAYDALGPVRIWSDLKDGSGQGNTI